MFVRAINAIKLEDSHLLEGVRYHTAGSEPFFYDASYNHTRQLGAIPVDLNGRCVVAEEIGNRHLIRMRPLKWKCTKVRDTIKEVNVNGFLMNNITFMPTIPQCVEIYQLCWL